MAGDDDLYWDDDVEATHNNLIAMNEAKKPKKTAEEIQNEYNDQKNIVMAYFIRMCGIDYLVIDIQKVINKFAGIVFEFRWSTKSIPPSLALYDGCRKVVHCIGFSWSTIYGRDLIFGSDSSSIEESIKFKVNSCEQNMKIGVKSNPKYNSKPIWFQRTVSSKIETTSMSKQKQDMFGSIFGHLDSQKQNSNIRGRIKAGDVILMRLFRKDKDAKVCTLEIKYNKENWKIINSKIQTPVVAAASLWSMNDSISFMRC